MLCGRGDTTFVICHVISRDHMRKDSYDLIVESTSTLVFSHYPVKFVGNEPCRSVNVTF